MRTLEGRQEAERAMIEDKGKNSLLTIELEWVKAELADYRVREEGHWEEKDFLELAVFFVLLGNHFAFLFEHKLEGAMQQFKETSYHPKGIYVDFLDTYKVLNNIPQEKFS